MAATLAGQTALITGGGTGIGKGIAEAFAREGAAVALAGRRRETVERVADHLRGLGAKAIAISGDVSKASDCARLVEESVKAFGGLHILVNNAGVAPWGPLGSCKLEALDAAIDIDLKGPLYLAQAALPHLSKHRERGGASILNISSSAALIAVKHFAVYSAAKAGLNQLTRCLALDLGSERIRVNCICPGVVETPLFESLMPKAAIRKAMADFATKHPLGRVGTPADIAELAVFLSSAAASWITGAVVPVDGGLSLG